MLIFSMYISAVFLFDHHFEIIKNLSNIKLHGIIFSSAFCASAGYIINHFYDDDKDAVYKPITTMLQKFLTQGTSLWFYVAFNIISLLIAIFLSPNIFIFFLVYQLLIWFYSHKLSRVLILNNLVSSVLMIFPFLALTLYYQNYSYTIISLSVFLFLIILIRDICKDIHSQNYDNIFEYNTLPNTLGLTATYLILDFLLLLLFLCSINLSFISELSQIRLFYILSSFLSLFLLVAIWFFKTKNITYLIWMIKFWIFLGTISLLFIDGNPLSLYFQKINNYFLHFLK